ncbi:MAG: hypothetical protein ABI585_14995 [Betaproteobacteria bacterium]
MKYSLTAGSRGIASVFDLLAEGLSGASAPSGLPSRAPVARVGVFERIEQALWRSRQRDLERSLDDAVDIADLEARMRRIERRTLY